MRTATRSYLPTGLLLLALLVPGEARAQDAPAAGVVDSPAAPDPDARLVLNFRDAPLADVLDYLSEQAGLVVINNVEMPEGVTVVSLQALTLDEALGLVNSTLRDRGFTTVRRDRLLRVVALADAKKQSVPVRMGADPEKIGQSDTVITQIIPLRFADAEALAANLEPLVSGTDSELSANTSSNALIVTNTEANVRRVAEIAQALDQSISQVRDVKVFKLAYADAEDTAELITEVFSKGPSSAEQLGRAIQQRFSRGRGGGDDRGRGGFGGGPPGGGGGSSGGAADTSEGAGASEVTAAGDARTNSVVVSADPEVMAAIENMITELDTDTAATEAVLVYRAKNTTAVELEAVFNALFQGATISRDSGSGTSSVQRTTGTNNTNGNNTGNTSGRGGGNNGGNTGGGNTGGGTTGGGTTGGGRGGGNTGGGNTGANTDGSASDLVNNVTAVADEATNSLLVLTAEVNFPRVQAILDALDHPVPQVLVRVLVAELTHEQGRDLGTQFSLSTEPEGNAILNTLTNFGSPGNGLNVALSGTDLTASISALETRGVLDVLSRPYILTRDNQEANILVGEEVPFVTNSRVTDTGNTINTIEYRDIGIILGVTPQINAEGLVVLTVSQELSSLLDSTVQISDGFAAQRIAKRTADTRIAVVNGQTVVIGGLMQERLTENVSKVPLLGDLPLIGALFRRTIVNKSKTELLLFLTPEVVMTPQELGPLADRVRAETEELEDTVAPGALQRHLDRMRSRPGVGPTWESDDER